VWSYGSFNGKYDVPSPKDNEDRVALARMMVQDLGLHNPLVVDPVGTNEACVAYGAWPERLYVVLDGRVVFVGGNGPFKYSVPDLCQWARKFFQASG